MTALHAQLGVEFRWSAGSFDDYHALAAHHYLGSRPATVHSVWRIEAHPFAPAGGCHAHAAVCVGMPDPRGQHAHAKSRVGMAPDICHLAFGTPPSPLWAMGGYPRLAGVAVVSYPAINGAARNVATGRRYCTPGDPGKGVALLNAEVRTISRVIVHPLYRGLGLATRLVRGVLASVDAEMIEALARMGEWVPFFRQAGMHELILPGRPAYYWRRRGSDEGRMASVE